VCKNAVKGNSKYWINGQKFTVYIYVRKIINDNQFWNFCVVQYNLINFCSSFFQ
jgi:hypothetical protein